VHLVAPGDGDSLQDRHAPHTTTTENTMPCSRGKRLRWQVPYGIVTLWSASVLMFLGGLYLLVREHAAVNRAVAHGHASLLPHLSGYAVVLVLLMVLLTYMTWRHLRSEQARRESERRLREMIQQANDALEHRVEARTAALVAANTSLQRGNAERQQTTRAMLEINNREQWRIGQDLHDGLGQLLTGMAFLSQALAQKLATKAMAEAAEATQLVQLANQALTWTRELVRGLSPIEFQGDGFIPALQDLATQAERLFGITCQVTCNRPPPLRDHTVATHLYRIAQEAVTNAVKHGQAKHVVLTLTTDYHRTILTVHDDGLGCPDVCEKPPGMGRRIMHQRASMIGASLTLQSNARGGATVVCVWPHPQAPGEDGEAEQWRDGDTRNLGC